MADQSANTRSKQRSQLPKYKVTGSAGTSTKHTRTEGRPEKRKISGEEGSRNTRRRTKTGDKKMSEEEQTTPGRKSHKLPPLTPAAEAMAANAEILNSPNPPLGKGLTRSPSKLGNKEANPPTTTTQPDAQNLEGEPEVPGATSEMSIILREMKNFFKKEFDTFTGKFEAKITDLTGSVAACNNNLGALASKVDAINVREEVEEILDAREERLQIQIKKNINDETAQLRRDIAALHERQKRLEERPTTEEPDNHERLEAGGKGSQGGKVEGNQKDSKYWHSRRCLRVWRELEGNDPVNDDRVAEDFIHGVLQVEEEDFEYKTEVERTRRIRTGRAGNTRIEILIVFNNIDTRDFVHSHARNLASHVDQKGKRTAGIKMEVPVHLLSTFKVLEKHGHELKKKYGAPLRRQIMYDDDNQSLYLDVKMSQESSWERVSPDTAEAERMVRERREKRKTRNTENRRTMSTIGSDTDEEEDGSGTEEEGERDDADVGGLGEGTSNGSGKYFKGRRPRK